MDCLLGIDVGSTSMKALVYDTEGHVLSHASRPQVSIANDPAHPNWQVYLPENIWDGIASAIHDAVSQLDPGAHVRAATVTGLGADAVPLDEHGVPLYPFINWLCPRTTSQFEWWLEHVGLEKTFQVTGWQPFVWSTVLRFMWLKENEPEIYKRTRQWLIVEDFVNFKLTGKYSTDYTDASATLVFDQRKLNWSDELLSLAGIDLDLLPKPQPSGCFVGEVTPEAAIKTGLAPGTPIFQGGHDYLIGALAAGIIKPGVILDVTGTWELVLTPTMTPQWKGTTRELGLTLEAHSFPGAYCMWGGGTAASMLEWYKDEIGVDTRQSAGPAQDNIWPQLISEARSSSPGAGGIFFLPHFNGTTCPNLDPRSLGAFIGLGDSTKRGDLVRAIIEGLDYAFVDMLRSLEQGVGKSSDRVIAIGGAVRNEFWMQNKADMSGIPIEVPDITEATALGAAMLAGAGIGVYQSLEDAVDRVCKPGKVFEPDIKLTSFYREMIEIYHEIYPALQQVNRRIYDRFKS
jgi:xylulokinase